MVHSHADRLRKLDLVLKTHLPKARLWPLVVVCEEHGASLDEVDGMSVVEVVFVGYGANHDEEDGKHVANEAYGEVVE